MRQLHRTQILCRGWRKLKPSCYDEGRCGGFWNAALTDREIWMLYLGMPACRVRPDAFQPGSKCQTSLPDETWAKTIMTPEERAREIAGYWIGLRKSELPAAEADIARHVRAAIEQAGGCCNA